MRFVPVLIMVLGVLLAPVASRAGDAATLEILGFSADGGIFAFEEYGVQDGSGFPYSDRFYLDTANDRFLPGTPIRVRLESESATVEQARAESRKKSQTVIADSVLAANRGFTAGANAVTELSADPHRMAVNPRPVFAPIDPPLEFRVEEYPVVPPEVCGDGNEIKGFRLLMVPVEDGATVRLLHEDRRIPQSRGCPLGYAIGAVQTFFGDSGPLVFAVLVAVRGMGFEGPDHRWIAIPGRIGN
ncbi:MAG: DUF2259 domain-containing protein [Rhizobiaceae bacterium]|nr:DUF2259 domain-containing protein [Rhizobiaceae bacterium]